MKRNRRISTRLLAATATAVIATALAPAWGQDVETIPEQTVTERSQSDTIVVTGSRIKRESFDNELPTVTIGSVELENRGFTNVVDALEDIPLVGLGTNNTGNNTQNGDNQAFVDLFNLGVNRTLTLVNGRRVVSGTQGTIFVPENAPGSQVDLSLFNPALIERTEIVTVGGGPIYGADAVAGVVNIILKDDFDGLDITAQGGITQRGDGAEYRVSGVWGKNFLDGRANITIAGEYLNQNPIIGAQGRDFLEADGSFIINPAGASGSDGLPNFVFANNVTSPFISSGGTIVTGQSASGFGVGTPIIPPSLQGFAGSNPGVNPLAFFGQCASGCFPIIPNTDAATNGTLPNLGVPLAFDPTGALVPFDPGLVSAGVPGTFGETTGGGGFSNAPFTNLRSDTERTTINLLGRYDITDNIRFKQEFIYSDINFSSSNAGINTNSSISPSPTAGSFAVPIFIDENPFLSPEAFATLDGLATPENITLIDGRRAFFLARSLEDTIGGVFDSGSRNETFRTASTFEGDFELGDRDFNWELSGVYGRATVENISEQTLDIEFALAADVVADAAGNPVCRQQLTGPQPITVTNPALSNIVTGVPLTPTQAQVDACVPLNLFGSGAPSQAAIDFVVTPDGGSSNVSEQLLFTGSFGGDIIDVPAGKFQFNASFEYRDEDLAFTPSEVALNGLGRNALIESASGGSRFLEGGFEGRLPIFGNDFQLPGFHALEFTGAVRVVNRLSSTDAAGFVNPPGTTDVTFTAGGTWRPIEQLQFRGNRTRSVRSPGIVELFGPAQTGFGPLTNPCAAANVDGGPNPALRLQNCIALFQAIDVAGPGTTAEQAADFIANFAQAPGNRPAATAGAPTLLNEQADNWSVGVLWEPSFIEGLTISGDYVSISISGEPGLVAPTTLLNNCVDSASFPDVTTAGSIAACDQVVFGIDDGTGNFVLPSTTAFGNPLPPSSPPPGSAAQVNAPGEAAFVFFAQGNLGASRLNGITGDVRYNFDVADVLGSRASAWGDINLRGTVFFLREFEESGSGTFLDTNIQDGEVNNPSIETRVDMIHSIGPVTHSLQWFRRSATVVNAQIDEDDFPEQNAAFLVPSIDTFNYNFAWDVTDNFTTRVIVENLLDTQQPFPFLVDGTPNNINEVFDPLGRRFTFAVQGRF